MRIARHSVLLLLVSLLCGGPALSAWAQLCMSTESPCTLCAHRAEPMHCMPGQSESMHPLVHTDPGSAAQIACSCSRPDIRTADVLLPSRPHAENSVSTAILVRQNFRPLAAMLSLHSRPSQRESRTAALRAQIPLPLRV